MDVLRRSATKSRLQRIKNEHIKKIMGVKKKPDIIDIIEKKRLQWYGHVKRMQEERLPKLIMEWIPGETPRWYLHLVVVEGLVSSSNPES
jgi:hypothetical protein